MSWLKGPNVGGRITIDDNINLTGSVLAKNLNNHPWGNVYYVDGKTGNDDYTGLLPTRAKKTIAAAVTVMNARIDWAASPWSNSDTLYIAPGTYAENLTSLPYGATVIGLGFDTRDGQNGVKILPATGDAVDVGSCINSSFFNIGFHSVDTAAAFDASDCNNVLFQDCLFSGLPAATTAVYAFWTSDATRVSFRRCHFCNADNGIYFSYTNGGDKATMIDIDHCLITECSATGIYTHTSLVGNSFIVRDTSIMGAGQTCVIGIDDNAGVIDECKNFIEASTAVSGVRSSNGSYGNGGLLT